MPPAPPRFSTKNCCLNATVSCSAISRPSVSAAPPGANGAMIRTGLLGQFCACVGADARQTRAVVSAAVRVETLFMSVSIRPDIVPERISSTELWLHFSAQKIQYHRIENIRVIDLRIMLCIRDDGEIRIGNEILQFGGAVERPLPGDDAFVGISGNDQCRAPDLIEPVTEADAAEIFQNVGIDERVVRQIMALVPFYDIWMGRGKFRRELLLQLLVGRRRHPEFPNPRDAV